MPKPIQQALTVLAKAQQEINQILSGPEYNGNLLEINTNFRRINSRLVFMGGVLEPESMPSAPTRFPPMTSFMGKEIKKNEKVTEADLNPAEADKQKFLSKVGKLWKELPGISPQSILNAYTIPEDVLVLRGVAKRAGVKDFAERPINQEFIEEIILGVGIKDEEAEQQLEIDEAVKSNDGKKVKAQK